MFGGCPSVRTCVLGLQPACRQLLVIFIWTSLSLCTAMMPTLGRCLVCFCHYPVPIGNESVLKIVIIDTINLFFYTAVSILLISSHNSFRVLFDKIATVCSIWKIYLYFSVGKWPAQGTSTVPVVSVSFRVSFSHAYSATDATCCTTNA